MSELKNIQIQSLTLSIKKEDNLTTLQWFGESKDKNPSEKLVPFIYDFVDNVNGELIIAFNELTYMNSSTIHPLIMFIKMLNDRKIKTQITYDKNSKWQEASFKAMKSLTRILPCISVEGT